MRDPPSGNNAESIRNVMSESDTRGLSIEKNQDRFTYARALVHAQHGLHLLDPRILIEYGKNHLQFTSLYISLKKIMCCIYKHTRMTKRFSPVERDRTYCRRKKKTENVLG
jgi:hypothetical protein